MTTTSAPAHSPEFRRRRFLNWFPLGLAYALLYMGRYNLTVAKTSLGHLMTKEDFGIIFGAGTFVYACSFLLNGPVVDRVGGRRGMLIALSGSATANALMAVYLRNALVGEGALENMRLTLSLLYGANMYFQSFAAVSIVKVNAHWFHVRERGGFSGIFGTMISSGIFLAFTLNGLILDVVAIFWAPDGTQWVVFAAPAVLLLGILVVEFFVLRDSPGLAGFEDFDTGDASSGDDGSPIPVMQIFKRILTNPIILTIALVEFCTGVLRNGVMHWFPIYAKEVWVLDGTHSLVYGPTRDLLLMPFRAMGCEGAVEGTRFSAFCATTPPDVDVFAIAIFVCFVFAILLFVLGSKARGSRRALLLSLGGLSFLAPFFPLGWGGLLFVAGVIGGNVAGWVSDLIFQSRRAPAAGFLYALLAVCTLGMVFALSPPSARVAAAGADSGLVAGDVVVEIAGVREIASWDDVRKAVTCFTPRCDDSTWDAEQCLCTTGRVSQPASSAPSEGVIPAVVLRDGVRVDVELKDPKRVQRAGDARQLKARPELPLSPWLLGILVFFMSLAVIGTHGLLSGTATMDFGGKKAAATAVGIIDGFVYLGTALQSIALGALTGIAWILWPLFLLPFALLGFFLLTRIWHAKAGKGGGH
jgi:sugar phosphate permease